MKHLLPHPRLSLAILAMWLLLNTSLAPATLLMGALVALAAPFAMIVMDAERPKLRSPRTMLRLCGRASVDLLRSTRDVALIILGRRRGQRVSGFIHVQLQIRSPSGLAVLAVLISSIPGTLWVQYDARSGRLMLHVLDLIDGDDWQQLIHQRYELPLMEIFE